MTFYNPNIQRVFDADSAFSSSLASFIKQYPIAVTYHLYFDYTEHTCSSLLLSRVHETIHFESPLQKMKLSLIDSHVSALFYDLIEKVYQHHVSTFADYIAYLKASDSTFTRNDIIYFTDRVYEFIELLVFSDLPNAHTNSVNRNYMFSSDTNLVSKQSLIYTTLFERLKLIEYLFQNIRIRIPFIRICPTNSIIHFDLTLSL